MLKISEVIYAKRSRVNPIEWQLLDIFKIAPNFPMNVSLFGHVNGNGNNEVQLVMRATTVSRRGNLQGLLLPCGIVVSNFNKILFQNK